MTDPDFICRHCGGRFGSGMALQQHESAKHPELQQHGKTSGFAFPEIKNMKKYGIVAIVVVLLLGFGYLITAAAKSSSGIGPVGSVHWHAQFEVIINGRAVDFSQSRYQLQAQQVHFEDRDGKTMHKHATGVTPGYFLNTLKIKADSTCITVEDIDYCAGGGKTLKYYMNGLQVDATTFLNRDVQDGDTYKIEYI